MTRWLRYSLHAAIVLVPCALLLPLHGAFYSDWYNHLWQIAYYAQHLRIHGSVPITLNAQPDLGMATPLFYGFLFFPILGVAGMVLGADLAIRVSVVALFLAQYLLTRTTAIRLGASRWSATAFAWVALWAIYPMTNLYNRNALPEFFAVGMLTCAVLLWFQVLVATGARERRILLLRFGFCVCLTMGIHPITGLCSIPFLTVLAAASLMQASEAKKILAFLWVPVVLTLVVLSAWLLILARYRTQTVMATNGMGWVYYPAIDTVLNRILPFDSRIGLVPLSKISTPYLEGTFNGPLILFVLALFFTLGKTAASGGRKSILVPLGLVVFEIFAFLFFASLDSSLTARLPALFNMVQFGYRLISYQDLTVFAGALFALYCHKQQLEMPRALVAGCILLTVAGMAVKISHVLPIRNSYGPLDQTSNLLKQPVTFNGYPDYELGSLYREQHQSEAPKQKALFKSEAGARFGQWAPLNLRLVKAGWVGTNFQTFPWTHFYLDGVEIQSTALGTYFQPMPDLAVGLMGTNHLFVAVELPAGQHSLDVRIIPDPLWLRLRSLGYLILALWGAVCLAPTRRLEIVANDVAA